MLVYLEKRWIRSKTNMKEYFLFCDTHLHEGKLSLAVFPKSSDNKDFNDVFFQKEHKGAVFTELDIGKKIGKYRGLDLYSIDFKSNTGIIKINPISPKQVFSLSKKLSAGSEIKGNYRKDYVVYDSNRNENICQIKQSSNGDNNVLDKLYFVDLKINSLIVRPHKLSFQYLSSFITLNIDHVTFYIGKFLLNYKDYDSAQKWFELTKKIYLSDHTKTKVFGRTLCYLGSIALENGSIYQAIEYFGNFRCISLSGLDYFHVAMAGYNNLIEGFLENNNASFSHVKETKQNFEEAKKLIKEELLLSNKSINPSHFVEETYESKLVINFIKTNLYIIICDFINLLVAYKKELENCSKQRKITIEQEIDFLCSNTKSKLKSFLNYGDPRIGRHHTNYLHGSIYLGNGWYTRRKWSLNYNGVFNSAIKEILNEDLKSKVFYSINHVIQQAGIIGIHNEEISYLIGICSMEQLNVLKSEKKHEVCLELISNFSFFRREYDDYYHQKQLIKKDFNRLNSDDIYHTYHHDIKRSYFEIINVPKRFLFIAIAYFNLNDFEKAIKAIDFHLYYLTEKYDFEFDNEFIENKGYELNETSWFEILQTMCFRSKVKLRHGLIIESYIDLLQVITIYKTLTKNGSIERDKSIVNKIRYQKSLILKKVDFDITEKKINQHFYHLGKEKYNKLLNEIEAILSLNNLSKEKSLMIFEKSSVFYHSFHFHSFCNWSDKAYSIIYALKKCSNLGRRKKEIDLIIDDCKLFSMALAQRQSQEERMRNINNL